MYYIVPCGRSARQRRPWQCTGQLQPTPTALLAALIAMFFAALVVPGVFDDEGALFGSAFLVV
jgi:hypothetical protein